MLGFCPDAHLIFVGINCVSCLSSAANWSSIGKFSISSSAASGFGSVGSYLNIVGSKGNFQAFVALTSVPSGFLKLLPLPAWLSRTTPIIPLLDSNSFCSTNLISL